MIVDQPIQPTLFLLVSEGKNAKNPFSQTSCHTAVSVTEVLPSNAAVHLMVTGSKQACRRARSGPPFYWPGLRRAPMVQDRCVSGAWNS